ncbi:Zn-ribbon domain-containing OB-fold protein [Pseudomonas lurida]|uniref:Zn-ribbon domain-containing OB-fold protein n=1 Tax=Pseudomonas lurida TaxID=244566 RepID=UPI00164781E0|nr:Zn-ribbon domain-containing OB-fold protein [Pseudomonas lurida]MBC3244977.1 Zn-ribbon domain-containing OB-fold protein [Pseudomonas lurida]
MTTVQSSMALRSRPIREGLFRIDPPNLFGSECNQCSIRTFPARSFCPACNSDDVEQDVALANEGTIYSYTVIRQAPGGRKTPYTLAYVDLTDGVRVMAQIDAPIETLQINLPVRLHIRPVGEQEGCELIGYVFVPMECAQ